MDHTVQYLLRLLDAYLHQANPETRADTDWPELVHLAHIHNVSGILGYMAMSHPICPDAQLNERLRDVCLNTIALFGHRAALAEQFCKVLSEHEIDHIAMKGFVLRGYYPVPELRTFGDIDFVIRPEDRTNCHKLMLTLNYQTGTDWEPVFSYIRENEYYELHTEIMEVDVSDKADFQGYFRNLWQHTHSTAPHRYEFTPEYHFLYLLTHIAKHVTGSGAGIRMYLDIAAFLLRFDSTLDWDWVRSELETLCLTDFANMVLTLTQRCFGVKSPLPLRQIPDDIFEQFLAFTMEGGIFGRSGRDSGTLSLKNQSRDKTRISRIGTVVRRLFPSAQSIRRRYTYLQDKPFLLPVAWVHRLIKTKDAWSLHAEEARSIMSADSEEVREMQRLYQEIGL